MAYLTVSVDASALLRQIRGDRQRWWTLGGERERDGETTHVLVEVKECGHDGVLDGSQIFLVPVDEEHPSDVLAAAGVTGNVLQQEGLLTTGRQREKICC